MDGVGILNCYTRWPWDQHLGIYLNWTMSFFFKTSIYILYLSQQLIEHFATSIKGQNSGIAVYISLLSLYYNFLIFVSLSLSQEVISFSLLLVWGFTEAHIRFLSQDFWSDINQTEEVFYWQITFSLTLFPGSCNIK